MFVISRIRILTIPQGLALPGSAFAFDIKTSSATIWDSGNEPVSGTTLADVGTAIANILKNADATANKVLCISSITTTQNELLKTFESVTGKKWATSTTPTTEILDRGRTRLAAKEFYGAFVDFLIVDLFQEGEKRGVIAQPGEGTNKELGLPARSVEEIVRGVLSE